MFDRQSPDCLTVRLISVSALYCAQAWQAFLGLEWLEEVGFSMAWVHEHRHRSADITVTVCGGFTLNSGRQQHTKCG